MVCSKCIQFAVVRDHTWHFCLKLNALVVNIAECVATGRGNCNCGRVALDGWIGEHALHGEFQKTMDDLELEY